MNERLQKYLAVLYYKLDLNPRIIGDNVVYESKPETLFKDAYEGAYDPCSLQEDFFFPHTLDQQGSTVETLPEEQDVCSHYCPYIPETFISEPDELLRTGDYPSALDNMDKVQFKCEDRYLELTYNS